MGRTARRIGLFAQWAVFCTLLASCNTITGVAERDDTQDPDVFDKVRSIDLLPRYPNQIQPAQLATGRRAKPVIYPAEPAAADAAEPASARQSSQPAASGDGYDLDFNNSPVASVAKVVLGDILGVGYVIDPRVQGTISLSSTRPIPKSDIIFVLENALRIGGDRAGAGQRGLPADACGRCGRCRRYRYRPTRGAGLRGFSGAAAIRLGADGGQADRQLRHQAGHGPGRRQP